MEGRVRPPATFTFGDFQLDCRARELRKRGRRLRMQQQPFEILLRLVTAEGELVTRDELRTAVWPRGTHIDFDQGINKAVNRLRQLLGDHVTRPRFIETLPKRGYRFLAPVMREALGVRAPSVDVRETVLKARYLWGKRTGHDTARSVDYFRRAIERDPAYAEAWAGLAETYVVSAIFGLDRPNVAFPAARAAAEKALALDDTVVQAHTALGEVRKLYEWDWIAAEDAYRRAIDIDPSYAAAHQHYAHLLVVQARDTEALTQIEIARQCDPVSPTVNAFVSVVWLEMRRYREAVDAALAGLELDSQAPLLHLFLGRAYAKLEDDRNAIASISRAADLSGRVPLVEAMLGFALARFGQRAGAEEILKGFDRDAHLRIVSPMDVAQVWLGLGERDRALAALEDAFDARSPRMINLNDPFFSELADEARYRQLLARLRLPIRDG